MQFAADSTLLRHLLLEVAELRRAIERLAPPARRLNRTDYAAASALLPAIAAAVESRDFRTAELVRMAGSQLPGAGELRRAIEATTGAVDAGTARRIGKLLRRIEGVDAAGYVVRRCDVPDAAGVVWRVDCV